MSSFCPAWRKAALVGCCLTYSCPRRLACSLAAACRSINITAGSLVTAQKVQACSSSKKMMKKQLRGGRTFVSRWDEMMVVEAFVVFATLNSYDVLNECFRKCHRWETRLQEGCVHTQRFCLLLLPPRPSPLIWYCRRFHPGCFLSTQSGATGRDIKR